MSFRRRDLASRSTTGAAVIPSWEYPVGATVAAAMRVIGVTNFGGPESLEVVELPDPEAGPGEVRIRVHAAAVNPTDTGLRSGARAAQLKDIPPPYVPGMDAAGVLDQIGDERDARPCSSVST